MTFMASYQKSRPVAQPQSDAIEAGKVIHPSYTQLSPTAALAHSEPTRGQKQFKMLVSAYCSCQKCCGKAPGNPGYGITASGVAASSETAAADWAILPRGTKIHVEDVGYRVVQDRGGAIKGHRLDLWFSSHEEALRFGVKTLTVRVIE
jgi:3D (Asp-Asp-Asp) domain-containing protein